MNFYTWVLLFMFIMCREYAMLFLFVCLMASMATLGMGILMSIQSNKFRVTDARTEFIKSSNFIRYYFNASDVFFMGVSVCNLETQEECDETFNNKMIKICYHVDNPNNSSISSTCHNRSRLSIILIVIGAISTLLFLIVSIQVLGVNHPSNVVQNNANNNQENRRDPAIPHVMMEVLELENESRNVVIGSNMNGGKCVIIAQPS